MESSKSVITDWLEEIASLMNLAGENPFKTRAYENAARTFEDLDEKRIAALLKERELTSLPGVGKGIAEGIYELIDHGKSTVRDELLAKIPKALFELTRISGLGPKKAMLLIEDLGIETLGELAYACRENRLAKIKGFGEKTQAKILEQIEFLLMNENKLRLPEAIDVSSKFQAALEKLLKIKLKITGEVVRKLEVVSKLEWLLPEGRELSVAESKKAQELAKDLGIQMEFEIHKATTKSAELKLASSSAFFKSAAKVEEAHEVPYECREFSVQDYRQAMESGGIVEQVTGFFHFHTTYSDGRASLSQMVAEAECLGYEYVGVSDHSQSAFYANGLKADDLKKQRKELELVRKEFPKMKIWWGVESDILADGSLDYSKRELEEFDFVIGSIHSRFQMDKAQMTDRILRALDQPGIKILGHLTGRLLLGRKPFELDFEKVLKHAKDRDVAIELNANPQRLDIDWRYGPMLRELGCKVVINPDAHEVAGIQDLKYGLVMARKALLGSRQVVNSWKTKEVESWLKT